MHNIKTKSSYSFEDRGTDRRNQFRFYSQRLFKWYLTHQPKLRISWRWGKQYTSPLGGRRNYMGESDSHQVVWDVLNNCPPQLGIFVKRDFKNYRLFEKKPQVSAAFTLEWKQKQLWRAKKCVYKRSEAFLKRNYRFFTHILWNWLCVTLGQFQMT